VNPHDEGAASGALCRGDPDSQVGAGPSAGYDGCRPCHRQGAVRHGYAGDCRVRRVAEALCALAVTRAGQVEESGYLRVLPPSRAGHYRIEVARGWLYYGDRHRALGSLQAARRVSPQLVRIHPKVRDSVHVIARNEPRPSRELRSFAAWLGID